MYLKLIELSYSLIKFKFSYNVFVFDVVVILQNGFCLLESENLYDDNNRLKGCFKDFFTSYQVKVFFKSNKDMKEKLANNCT